ncbi:MAG: hypothetical protein D6824_08290 [Planctomycetota bacterium]|nr:MAG: hypothetical protein D6824_08290 [Planctomycetota bacterium]
MRALNRWDVDALISTLPVSGQARATLPLAASPPAIAAAAERALQRRGYSLTRDDVTQGRAVVQARTAVSPESPLSELFARRATLTARETRRSVVVEVEIAPQSDAVEARAILHDTLELLRPAKR